MKMKWIWGVAVLVSAFACGRKQPDPGSLSSLERDIIRLSDSVMYVLNVADKADSVVLRTPCVDFSDAALQGPEFQALAEKMLATVSAVEQGGVGIAAPQVGISHRVIAVCRLDKEGEPFEIYPNVRIDSLYGGTTHGPEGCLSIPPLRGLVPRRTDVMISYKDPKTLQVQRDTISGYTAVIFQHECDHLDGILYTDRADTVFYNPKWAEERAPFAAQGRYDKPAWMKELGR